MSRTKRRVRQHELVFRGWGGKRAGAGRKPKGEKAGVSHAARPAFAARHPIHLTLRVKAGLPSMRRDAARVALERCFAATNARGLLRIVHGSIQTNHLHLIVETRDRHALSRGAQGLQVRVARALNRLWKRRGTVFSDRYHAHVLRTPREVRNALAYVLLNARHHGIAVGGVDPFSSGAWFDGWKDACERVTRTPREPWVVPARTWLLAIGWRRHGRIALDEGAHVDGARGRARSA